MGTLRDKGYRECYRACRDPHLQVAHEFWPVDLWVWDPFNSLASHQQMDRSPGVHSGFAEPAAILGTVMHSSLRQDSGATRYYLSQQLFCLISILKFISCENELNGIHLCQGGKVNFLLTLPGSGQLQLGLWEGLELLGLGRAWLMRAAWGGSSALWAWVPWSGGQRAGWSLIQKSRWGNFLQWGKNPVFSPSWNKNISSNCTSPLFISFPMMGSWCGLKVESFIKGRSCGRS